MSRRVIRFAGVLFGLFSFALTVAAQSTEAEIKARLKDKPLYLRGFWREDTLHFDDRGILLNKSGLTSFTLSGFDFDSSHIKKDKLIINGKRVGTEFTKNSMKRVRINGEAVKIEIALPPDKDYGPALSAVFADGLAELAPMLPSYWRQWAKANLAQPHAVTGAPVRSKDADTPSQIPAGDLDAKRVGGAVHAPVLMAHHEAEFNNTARQLRYNGITVVGLVISREGFPTRLRVVRPLGLGLDEQALAAVQSYLFSPAMEDGKPVPVYADIEVSFQIY